MKRLLATTLALALVFMAGAWAQEYQARTVICGTLLKYKSSLWKELPSAPKEYLAIRFAEPFEMEHSNWENEDGGRAGKVRITEFQLDYAGEDSALKALIGKKVIAIGTTMERNLAGQMRPIIFSVEAGNIKAGAFMVVQETAAPAQPAARRNRKQRRPPRRSKVFHRIGQKR